MRKYICQRPSTFGGQRFVIGEEIPAELVDPAREKTLLKYGTITAVEASDPPAAVDVPPETPPAPADKGDQDDGKKNGDADGEGTEQPADGDGTPPKKGTGKKGDQK